MKVTDYLEMDKFFASHRILASRFLSHEIGFMRQEGDYYFTGETKQNSNLQDIKL